jgi:hypothetical protein
MLAAGLLAFIAQAKYDSFILEVITIISATSLLSRVVLGYWRLAQRWACLPEQHHMQAKAYHAGDHLHNAACLACQ